MKQTHLFKIILLSFCTICLFNCNKDEDSINYTKCIEGLTADNFPVMDCSTSTHPLMNIVAYKLMGIPYSWQTSFMNGIEKFVLYDYNKVRDVDELDKVNKKLNSSTTHGSFVNLIDNKVELILASRSMSRDEKQYAEEKNVNLIEKPIGLDGFIFIRNKENPVKSLASNEIKAIYTGKITNWKEVGGQDATISPYMRNRNSGSQEKMETLVMGGEVMMDWPEMIGGGMTSPFYSLSSDMKGIAYTPYYYCTTMVDDPRIEIFSINGIEPNRQTIASRQYIYTSEIYTAVRADIDKSSMAWQIFEFVTSAKANAIVEESGYIKYY